ncbi:MAG: isoleucine--tRNA ligase [Candidatus Micrarchaeota archaeon]|nr:isoleucine--tRNA ligase [Candidatus Micrarchaeota archaeon]
MANFPLLKNYDSAQVEALVRKYWDEKRVPQRLSEQRRGAKKFLLLDGPPYVNAEAHVGHVKTTACKDIWSRFMYMKGNDVFLQPGFDCHGLPVEVIVQKELGVESKQDIERMGIDKFDAKCLEKVLNNERLWMEYYKLLGAWRAYFEPYFTYKNSYIESAWWTVKRLHEKGFLVQGEAPTYWCPSCETVLSGYEVSDSYKDVSDPSVYLKFKIKGAKGGNEFLLVWTTTPWTLPGNVAVFVHPDEIYVKAKVKATGEVLLLAEKRAGPVLDDLLKWRAGKDYEIVGRVKGAELDGLEYEPILDVEQSRELKKNPKAYRVCLSIPIMKFKKYKKHKMAHGKEEGGKAGKTGESGASAAAAPEEFEEFVVMTDGSGLVHCAPGHGATDHYVGIHYGLPAVSPVDEQGRFTEKVGAWKGVFVKEADKAIVEKLEADGKLLHHSRITHSYPLCWRCKSPLIFRLTKQWYFKIDLIKEKMLEANEGVDWMPAFGKDAFRNWLEQSTDWCISRQRYWATPLPVWTCSKCGKIEVIGSVAELRNKAVRDPGELKDLHRHTVDKILLKCGACGAEARRVPDVCDVWYDSGVAPWASLGYPLANKEFFEESFPVGLVNESQDQVRGWFYYLFFAAMAAFDKPAFKRVAMMGWVVDEKGEKMSKSLGNVVYAKAGVEKVGADVIRTYYCWETAPWDVQKFSFRTAEDVKRSLGILWNCFMFYKMYAAEGFKPGAVDAIAAGAFKNVEDRWLLSRLNTMVSEADRHFSRFEFHHAGRKIIDFALNDFSRWYIKLARDRVSLESGEAKDRCLSIIHHVLLSLAKAAAPVTPFLSEYLYDQLDGAAAGAAGRAAGESVKNESIHFCDYPVSDERFIDKPLEERMARAMEIVEAAGSARQEAAIKLRWPVKEIVAVGDAVLEKTVAELNAVLVRACNAQRVVFWKKEEGTAGFVARDVSGGKVFLNPVRDEALVNESLFRELVRAVQDARKKKGFDVKERVLLTVFSRDRKLADFLRAKEKELAKEVGAAEAAVVDSEPRLTGEHSVELAVEGAPGVSAKFSRA